jgi:hypothetical protein
MKRTEMLTSRIGQASGIDEKRLLDFNPLRAEVGELSNEQ